MRARAVLPRLSGLSTNTVSGWPNSRAIACIVSAASSSASSTTASGLPAKRLSVKTSSVAKGSFICYHIYTSTLASGLGRQRRPLLAKLAGAHAHERLAAAFGNELAVLVKGAMVEVQDAGARPRFRLALVEDLGRAMHGVALEQRMRELHLLHAEIGDGGADCEVGDGNSDHQPEREQRIHQGLSPLGLLLAEVAVDVQGLRVERHVGEQHIVHLRHGPAQRVLVNVPHREIVEVETPARVPLCRDPSHWWAS